VRYVPERYVGIFLENLNHVFFGTGLPMFTSARSGLKKVVDWVKSMVNHFLIHYLRKGCWGWCGSSARFGEGWLNKCGKKCGLPSLQTQKQYSFTKCWILFTSGSLGMAESGSVEERGLLKHTDYRPFGE